MELNEYQEKAMTTCLKSCDNVSYMALNLVGEVGEFCGKLAKAIRKGQIKIDGNQLVWMLDDDAERDELETAFEMEAGDIFWQFSSLCKVMGWKLENIAQGNLDKLESRKQRGVIDGNGDNR